MPLTFKQTFIMESGVVVDRWGYEIVAENSVMSRLSAIEGFDGLTAIMPLFAFVMRMCCLALSMPFPQAINVRAMNITA